MPSDLPRLVTRIPHELNDKFLYICNEEDRTASNMLGRIIKDFVDEYESTHGELIVGEDGTLIAAKPKSLEGKSSTSKTG